MKELTNDNELNSGISCRTLDEVYSASILALVFVFYMVDIQRCRFSGSSEVRSVFEVFLLPMWAFLGMLSSHVETETSIQTFPLYNLYIQRVI